jgi:DNA-binding transcriptional LysR family regulator
MNKIVTEPSAAASLDLDVLRSVVAIAEAGSISAAAQRIGRTPAAVSMQIKKLEETLGRSLFERMRQGMRLSAEGERLLPYANRMVDLNREALDAFRAPELTGTVNVGMIDSIGALRMARIFAAFARSHPNVTVNASIGCSCELAPRLDRGDLDLTVLTPGSSTEARDSDLLLHEEPLVWIASASGRAWKQDPVPLSVASDGCAWRAAATQAIRRSGMTPRIAYISDQDAGQLAAAEADLAVAPMPRSYVGPGLIELGAREGFPPLGTSRIVLRVSDVAGDAARALARSIAETFGKTLEDA